MPQYQSLYDILGVSKTASADEIRKAYRRKALETHPDKLNPRASAANRRAAEAQFHLICSAFETLSDPQRREAYDAWGNKLDPQISLEETAKRKEDRNAWASGLKAEYERRKGSRNHPVPPLSKPPPHPTNNIPRTSTRPKASSTSSAPKSTRLSRPDIPPPSSSQGPHTPHSPPTQRSHIPPFPLSRQNVPSDEEERLITELLQEVRAQLPPDYEERKRRAIQKKLERERAEIRRQTMSV